MVMIEKKLGVCLVDSLYAILLRKADKNFHSAIMFGGRLMERAQMIGFIPEEQLAEKQCTAEDGAFQKVLNFDYCRLRNIPFSLISADAANCYNHVHHVILALLMWALGMSHGPIAAMLLTIVMMKYYIRTGFNESQNYMGGDKASAPMHSLNQGVQLPFAGTLFCRYLFVFNANEGILQLSRRLSWPSLSESWVYSTLTIPTFTLWMTQSTLSPNYMRRRSQVPPHGVNYYVRQVAD
jgi:hypothetical protein